MKILFLGLLGFVTCFVVLASTGCSSEDKQPLAVGEKTYNKSCRSCHRNAKMGAPHDAATWKPRLDKGRDVLIEHAMRGFKKMPAKGRCMSCSEQDILEALSFMLQETGLEERPVVTTPTVSVE